MQEVVLFPDYEPELHDGVLKCPRCRSEHIAVGSETIITEHILGIEGTDILVGGDQEKEVIGRYLKCNDCLAELDVPPGYEVR